MKKHPINNESTFVYSFDVATCLSACAVNGPSQSDRHNPQRYESCNSWGGRFVRANWLSSAFDQQTARLFRGL